LLADYAERLSPEIAVVGFYFGNDLAGTHAFLAGQISVDAMLENPDTRFLGPLRTWLARHSVVYQASKLGFAPLVDRLRFLETQHDAKLVRLVHPIAHTAAWGLEALVRMRGRCAREGIRFLVLLIPTKESVLWALVDQHAPEPGRSRVARVVEFEAGARARAVAYLGAAGVEFIDPLPALREAARATRLYAGGVDGHPNGTGYRILAEAVARRLGAGLEG
jgi:hypothetical protein